MALRVAGITRDPWPRAVDASDAAATAPASEAEIDGMLIRRRGLIKSLPAQSALSAFRFGFFFSKIQVADTIS